MSADRTLKSGTKCHFQTQSSKYSSAKLQIRMKIRRKGYCSVIIIDIAQLRLENSSNRLKLVFQESLDQSVMMKLKQKMIRFYF